MAAVDALEEYLRTATPLAILRNPGSGGETYIVSLGGAVSVIAKYAGRRPNVRQEVAAWQMARLLGWDDMVAASVLSAFRPSPGDEPRDSSIQVVWQPHEVGPDLDQLPPEDVLRGAIFDAIVMCNDRHPNNWLACPPVSSGQARLKLIDHESAWSVAGQPGSQIYNKRVGHAVPAELRTDLERALKRIDGSSLSELIGGDAVSAVQKRLTFVIQSGTLGVP